MKDGIDALLVSVDISRGKDHAILLVGRKHKNQIVDIVNAFQGEEALRIYEDLLRREKNEGSE